MIIKKNITDLYETDPSAGNGFLKKTGYMNLDISALKLNFPRLQKNYSLFPDNYIKFNLNATIKNSYIMKLANLAFSASGSSGRFSSDLSGRFSGSASKFIPDNYSSSNNDCLALYFEQLDLIFRKTDIYDNHNFLKNNDSTLLLYVELLDSFWNKSVWKDLFPSMPGLADKIFINRAALTDLLLRQKNKFQLDSFCANFFKTARIENYGQMISVSFMDFYIFTWLSHFGIINYLEGTDFDPVMIELTNLGRLMLKFLSFSE